MTLEEYTDKALELLHKEIIKIISVLLKMQYERMLRGSMIKEGIGTLWSYLFSLAI